MVIQTLMDESKGLLISLLSAKSSSHLKIIYLHLVAPHSFFKQSPKPLESQAMLTYNEVLFVINTHVTPNI